MASEESVAQNDKSDNNTVSSENPNTNVNIDNDEPSFGDLAKMMKRMGQLVGSVTTDLNKNFGKMGDIFAEFSKSLGDDDKIELQKLFISLTEGDKKILTDMVNANDKEGLEEWFGEKSDNKKLIDTLLSSMEVFKEAMDMGNNLTKEVSDVFGEIFPTAGNKFGTMLGDLMKNVEKGFPSIQLGVVDVEKSFPSSPKVYRYGPRGSTSEKAEESTDDKTEESTNEKAEEPSDDKTEESTNEKAEESTNEKAEKKDDGILKGIAKSLGENLGKDVNFEDIRKEMNKVKAAMNKVFNSDQAEEPKEGDISTQIYRSIAQAFRGFVDENPFDDIKENFDSMVDTMEETVGELSKKENERKEEQILKEGMYKFLDMNEEEKKQFEKSVKAFDTLGKLGEKIESGLNQNIRQGLITDTAAMIHKHNKLSDDIDNVVKVLNPIEIKLLELQCGGELPMNFRLRMMENTIKDLDDKLTQSINHPEDTHEEINDSDEKFNELSEKIDDIAINLDILLTKLSKLIK